MSFIDTIVKQVCAGRHKVDHETVRAVFAAAKDAVTEEMIEAMCRTEKIRGYGAPWKANAMEIVRAALDAALKEGQ